MCNYLARALTHGQMWRAGGGGGEMLMFNLARPCAVLGITDTERVKRKSKWPSSSGACVR